MRLTPTHSTLFPYTTLFRSPPSVAGGEDTGHGIRVPAPLSALPRSLRRYQPDQVPRVFSQSRRFVRDAPGGSDRKSTRLNSSHVRISYAVFCLKKKNI